MTTNAGFFSIMACDGSGILRASILTMTLLEGTNATTHKPFVVCSVKATVTIHRYVDLAKVFMEKFARY